MKWEVEFTEEFSEWWNSLMEEEKISVDASVTLLEYFGTQLKFPHSTHIEGTKKVKHLRELRVQHKGQPFRILYAFDPRRTAILLIGGNKRGDNGWYKKFVPVAEKLYLKHLATIKEIEL